MAKPPSIDIDLRSFSANPYPAMATMRRDMPVAWVNQLGAIVLTRHAHITQAEKDIAFFSSHQPQGLMTKLMGENMMRKDGPAHLRERKLMLATLTTRQVRERWMAVFEAIADEVLRELALKPKPDLMRDYALPFSGRCLLELTGLRDCSYNDLDAWSQAMIDGISNYSGDPAIELRCNQATKAIDDAIDQHLSKLSGQGDASLLSVMHHAELSDASLKANIKLTISGGQNEPRDAIGGLLWVLLARPHIVQAIEQGSLDWRAVTEEYLRWLSPIGMSPRRAARAGQFAGFDIELEQRVFFLFSAANRDEAVFDQPDEFNPWRDSSAHIAFGAGPHFCAGAWAAKAMIADVALPRFFARFPRAKLAKEAESTIFHGWAFRGPLALEALL
ncbi:MAG: cytochrome P450 [Betaproteobacteria bacterium]